MPKKLIAARSSSRWPEPASPTRPASGRTRSRHASPTRAAGQVSGPSKPPAMAPPNSDQQDHHQQPLDLLGELVQPRAVVVRALPAPQGQRRDEHGEEAVAVDQLGQAVGEQGDAEGDQVVARPRAAGGARRSGRSAGRAPARPAARRRRPRRSSTPRRRPATPASRTPGVAPCRATAMARLTNGKARPSLSPASEVRLKRTSSSSGSCGGPTWTSEASTGSVGASTAPSSRAAAGARPRPAPAEQGDAGDRQRHGDRQQPPGDDPAPPAERPVELQPRAHEGDDHDQLGQALGEVRVLQEIGLGAGARDAEQGEAERDADDRQRQREAAQERRQPSDRRGSAGRGR